MAFKKPAGVRGAQQLPGGKFTKKAGLWRVLEGSAKQIWICYFTLKTSTGLTYLTKTN